MGRDDYEHIEIRSRFELRSWLEQHHGRDEGVWLRKYKKHHEHYVPWEHVVQELLCWGWIDSMTRKLDADRSMLLITPRKPGSMWSRINKEHVEVIEAAGLMQPAGRARIEAAKSDGSWEMLDDIDALIEPDDLATALDAEPAARAAWDEFSASAKKLILWWVKSAKREATRSKRISETARLAALGLRAQHPEAKGR